MSVPVIRSPQALADLEEIADYLEAPFASYFFPTPGVEM
jgi:hypothetical protein